MTILSDWDKFNVYMITEYDLDKFDIENSKRPIVIIGAGKNAKEILDSKNWDIRFAIDSNADSIREISYNNGLIMPVYNWEKGVSKIGTDDIILITPSDYTELLDKLFSYKSLRSNKLYLYIIMKALQWDKEREIASSVPYDISCVGETKIPKIIHYFWFSGDPFPEKVQKCIDSWKKFCPDYEIRGWNLDNYHTDNEFCNEALKHRDWAFASDFGRCDVLYRYGGIYLDTDVELVRNFDNLLFDEGFMCFESKLGIDPGSGMGSIQGHDIMREIREKYYNVKYINEDGTVNHPHIIRMYTDVLEEYGLILNAEYQQIRGFAIYPPLVMSPYSYMTGRLQPYDKTYSIHHWVSAWVSNKVRKEIDDRKKYFEINMISEG